MTFCNIIRLFILALLSVESVQAPAPSNPEVSYELRVALWKTRSPSRRHWAFQVNEKGSRSAFQIDIADDADHVGVFRPRMKPSSSLDDNVLAGTGFVGTITQAQFELIKQNVISRYPGIEHGGYKKCRDFIIEILEWAADDEQKIITKVAYETWKARRNAETIEILRDPNLRIDVSRSHWGRISEADAAKSLSVAEIDRQMEDMYENYVKDDNPGLASYLRDNNIDTDESIDVDAWTGTIRKYITDAALIQKFLQKATVDPSSKVFDTAEGGQGREGEHRGLSEQRVPEPAEVLEGGAGRGRPPRRKN